MRWIVLLLLVANIGAFAWFRYFAGPAAPAVAGNTAEVPALPEGKRIELVGEVPANTQPRLEQEPKPQPKRERAVNVPAAVAGKSLCTIIGPVEEVYQGEDIVERLAALQIPARLREIQMAGQMRYWVYLSPLGSRQEALRKLRELQAEGVDTYLIPKGSLTNGISFGIFSEEERAESLAAELRQRGYPVLTREEPRTYLERWILLEAGAEAALAEAFWQQLQLDYPQMDRKQNLCQELESD
ncbi:hypothetical protein Maes01_01703 [Microbulbifer aestuariivivens]|uniref:SPOR domain-containing protein n=1 Tax=Microbulbifer aestuariivivens TaxID=1908308 RepID=A0ABP9WPK5_9GAMM